MSDPSPYAFIFPVVIINDVEFIVSVSSALSPNHSPNTSGPCLLYKWRLSIFINCSTSATVLQYVINELTSHTNKITPQPFRVSGDDIMTGTVHNLQVSII